MIPSRKRFQRWSLPSKYTYVGFWLALVGVGLTLLLEIRFWDRDTVVIDYRPTIPEDVQVGNCWTRSFTLHRADTWRCGSEGYIYDPCFQFPQQIGREEQFVVCGASPLNENDKAFVLELEEPLPTEIDPTQMPLLGKENGDSAWILVLRNGFECRFLSGASTLVLGYRANYFCRKRGTREPYDTSGLAIVDRPRVGRVWQAQLLDLSGDTISSAEVVPIDRVYR